MTIIHIIPGPTKVLRTKRGEARWCFGCRKRVAGTHILLDDEMPSYYEPAWVYECDGCGEDQRHFPGCEPA